MPIRQLSIHLLTILFSLSFLSLIYYIGLNQDHSFNSLSYISVLFLTMILIGPLRSYLSQSQGMIKDLAHAPHMAKVLILGMLFMAMTFALFYGVNHLGAVEQYVKAYPELYHWVSSNDKSWTYNEKILLLISPLYLLYLITSYYSSKLQTSYAYSLVPIFLVALTVFLMILPEVPFAMKKFNDFGFFQWLISPLMLLYDLLQLAVFLLSLALTYFIINPFLMTPAYVATWRSLRLFLMIPVLIGGIVSIIVPLLIVWLLINSFNIDIYFFYSLEYITMKIPAQMISVILLVIYLLVSVLSVKFIFKLLGSMITVNSRFLKNASLIMTIVFFAFMGFEKYTGSSYDIMYHKTRESQQELGAYFCKIKQEDINYASDGGFNHSGIKRSCIP